MYRNRITISQHYQGLLKKINKEIMEEEDNYILMTDTQELTDYYFSENSLTPIEFDTSKDENLEHKKEVRTVKSYEREYPYNTDGDLDCEYEYLILSMPIIPTEDLDLILSLQSSTISFSGEPKIKVINNTISFELNIRGYSINYDNDKIKKIIENEKKNIRNWINEKNNDIDRENEKLKKDIYSLIKNRKTKLQKDKERISSLIKEINIPLKRKENEAIKRIKLDTKPLVKRIKPTAKQPEEYILDREKVLDIITVIDNQGIQFEKTPSTFADFDEPNFRDVILVSLNSLFAGNATGETFSNRGKTDIYLNIQKGNILICECKIWRGEKYYLKTIDQILGYLTWRHNYGIIITFVKIKNFSKILDKIEGTVLKHKTYTKGFKKINGSHYQSTHKLEQDDYKNVEIHHLFYNIYTNHQP